MNAARKAPPKHASSFNHLVSTMLFRLECFSNDGDHDAGYHLAYVFSTVTDNALGIGWITPHERDQLLRSICIARVALPQVFPDTTSVVRMSTRGFDALEALVIWWAGTPSRRARQDYFLSDMRAYARIYRNELINAELAKELCARFDSRRTAGDRLPKIAADIRRLAGAA